MNHNCKLGKLKALAEKQPVSECEPSFFPPVHAADLSFSVLDGWLLQVLGPGGACICG